MLVFFSGVSAQKKLVKGLIYDSVTKTPLTNAVITNPNTGDVSFTNHLGFFTITASRADMIFLNAFNYQFDTIKVDYDMPDTLLLYLTPEVTSLPNVTINTQGYNRYQIDSLQRRASFISDVGLRHPSISQANSQGFGVGINLDAIFSNKNRQRKMAYKNFERHERGAYVDYRYPDSLVAKYTGLQGEALANFKYNYTPTYEWLRAHPSEQAVIYYINDKLKARDKK